MLLDEKPSSDKKGADPVGERILGFCLAIFVGAILLSFAVELLAAIWGWLVLISVILGTIWIGVVVYRYRRDRW